MMKKIIVLFFIVYPGLSLIAQQLPFRSALGSNDISVNPAATGLTEHLEGALLYRKQWMGFSNAPTSAMINVQYPFIDNNFGVGLILNNDLSGPLKNQSVGLNYAYKFKPGLFYKDLISIGIQAKATLISFDPKSIIAFDPDDLLIYESQTSILSPNVGIGFIYYSSQNSLDNSRSGFYFGMAANQLLNNQVRKENRGSLQRTIHANAVLGTKIIRDYFFIEPSIWIHYSEPQLTYVTANLLFEIDKIWAGFSYQTDNTVALYLGYKIDIFSGEIKVGLLGDYNIGISGMDRGASVECSIRYRYELD